MQCSSCGSIIQTDFVVCPICSASVSSDTDDSSPYTSNAVPYIEYDPGVQMGSTLPASQPAGTVMTGRDILNIPLTKSSTGQDQSEYWTAQPMPVRRSNLSLGMTVLLSLLTMLIIAGGVGLIYYVRVAHPAEFDAQATSVAQTYVVAQAQSTAQASTRATAVAAALTPQDIYIKATSGTPVINDPLTSQDGSIWHRYGTPANGCSFSSGAYHIRFSVNNVIFSCYGVNSFFDNLAFQGQATIIKGDSSGLLFRALKSGSYLFEVSYSGTYDLLAYKGASPPTVLVSGTSTVINTGLDQSNLLTVVAYGNHLYLYINKQPVASVTDSTNTTGQIALSGGTTTGSADVAFNNVQVWSI